jgi:hypothetical protein
LKQGIPSQVEAAMQFNPYALLFITAAKYVGLPKFLDCVDAVLSAG